MADAAAVILSAIEKLDSWLHQKEDHQNDEHARPSSLRLEKKDLLVGMVEVCENNNEMLYGFLVWVAEPWDVEEEKADKDKVYSFVGEMEDLWELNCREKLHSLLVQMLDLYFEREDLFSLAVKMADLWRDSEGKLNKEMLYSWLAKKTDLWEEEMLFSLLEGMRLFEGPDEEDWKYVEGVRNDLRFILDFLNKWEDQGSSHRRLHSFISDVVEIAHGVQLLVHLKDSDPIILLDQIFYHIQGDTINFKDSFDAIKPIHERLQEIEKRVRKFRVDERSQINNVREELVDAAAIILSAIEELDSWLIQRTDLRVDDYAELCSLRLEKKDLLVGMAELWENNKEMLYSLLVEVADLWDVQKKVDNEKLYSFLGEMDDLWEVNCREKLHSLLVEMLDLDPNIDGEKLFSLGVEMTDLWKVSKGKLNKQKLNSWLAKRTDLWEEDKLFRLLKSMTFVDRHDKNDWMYVEGVRNDLRFILDFINILEDQGSSHGHLHYFISDVAEMAQHVQLLVHLKDSDPFILFLQIFNLYMVHIMNFSVSILKFFAQIKPIHKWLQETEKRVWKFGGDETSQINNVREETDHHVVGLKEDVELLLRNTKTTIRIQGLAGSGKTTLTREFYNHPEIVDGFECRAWVCLSSWNLSRKELLIKLIRQFIDSKRDDMLIEKMENKALRKMLHQHLQDKPYVLVLDDVSEETYLQYVFRTLPRDERSRLLFTTRNHVIRCHPYGDCEHTMKNLDGDKSWQLLLQTALRSDEKIPKQLEKKGREMLMRKCGGLPLAIKEVGRQWSEKRRSGSEWKELVVEESLMNLELSETLVALESTYLNMDPQVKPCFLHLAFFKEGTIIRKKKLIEICTAGGLDKRLIQLGFLNLSQQSIIEKVDETSTSHSTKTIRINVHFHRLSITKAVDEIGFRILSKDGSNRGSHQARHHCVIHYNYSSTNQDKHFVSLFFHGGGCLSDICWKHFEQLRVLDMEGFGLKILPETVGDLAQLRYLGLRNNYVQELPQSLRRLKMIEVLDIAQNFMVEVPDILWEMDRLHHLYMSDIICQKPLKIDALMNLKILTYISIHNWTYEVSDMKNKMTSLRRLGIEEVDENSNVSKLFASLAQLDKLDFLILRGFRFRSMPSLDELGLLKNITRLKLEGGLTRLPSATNFPPKIRCLSLVNSCLDEDPIPIMEKLPQLSNLNLRNAYTGHEMVISKNGFFYLNNLVIREFWNLRNIVKVGKGGMGPFLRFEINSCPYLETVPQEILSRLDPLRSQSLKCAAP